MSKAKTARKTAKKTTARRTIKTERIVALMRRPSGVTRKEVLKATGWKAVSMQQIAEKAHVKLRVDKKVTPFKYRVAK